ncbi:hypothetical protein HMPREF0239_04647 [Clostridium sp. ATCC BAA-442]|nr:hypothetical protein HMPREF0239_04647 [Clostridium sp. ATCC BAA-442]
MIPDYRLIGQAEAFLTGLPAPCNGRDKSRAPPLFFSARNVAAHPNGGLSQYDGHSAPSRTPLPLTRPVHGGKSYPHSSTEQQFAARKRPPRRAASVQF